MADSVSPALARRIALAAQGFGAPRPAEVGTRQLNGLIERLGLLQLDSVNVLERSHYLPVFARLGAYDKTLLDRLTFAGAGTRARYVEYWAHEAAVIPVATLPNLMWRMRHYQDYPGWPSDEWMAENGHLFDWVRDELRANGPMAASEIEHDSNGRQGPWWGWSGVKRTLEVMFRRGEVFSAGRTRFERRYGLAEQVLPAGLLDAEPVREDAIRELVRHAVRAHGIGTVNDIADYFRLYVADTKAALRDLVDAGSVLAVEVPGWGSPAFLDAAARRPRRIEAAALLSPFDPVVWERDRALRMFGFHYRIEIYTPAPKRIFGYYTLPVLVDDALVGRIDLKNDRQRKVLRVQSAWRETHAPVGIEQRIVAPLRELAAWQGCESIEVVGRGDLARDLAGALGAGVVTA